jgi:hypothetical protein
MAAFVGVDFPAGMKLIESIHLTLPVTEIIDRSWKERLFSRPWKPLEKTKKQIVQYPDPNVYTWGDLIICHPMVALRIREELIQERSKEEPIPLP